MATRNGAIAAVGHQDSRWKYPLLFLCALSALCIIGEAFGNFGLNGRPWYGWWDSFRSPSGAFALRFNPPRFGGATAKAGIRDGDIADLRDQTYAARVVLFTQPLATQATILNIRRGSRMLKASLLGSSVWEGEPLWKVSVVVVTLASGIWFLACAMLIALRRASSRDGRFLTLILLCLVPGFLPQNASVVPQPSVTLLIWALTQVLGLVALALLVVLSSRHGRRTLLRRGCEVAAFGIIALAVLRCAAFCMGVVTLWVDPVPYWFLAERTGIITGFASLAVLLVCAMAAHSTDLVERPRTTWLLVALPAALTLSAVGAFAPVASSWFGGLAFNMAATALVLIGALLVTYAMLKRRVLDFEFVLNRTAVFAAVSLIVVAAFVLLEWLLGTVIAGVSHTTGLVANAALALVLGLSLNAIHKRVETFVDAIFFRKRHEDERALLEFSKEAAYVTDRRVLLDQAIEKIGQHTDSRNATLYLDGGGAYAAARSFGEGASSQISDNDPAILALKTWHKPLDPHRYASALRGALALPMLARGRLLGVLLLEERAGGEAYAPDEIEALSQFAHGVGSALDVLSTDTVHSESTLPKTLAAIADSIAALGERVDALPDKLSRVRSEG